MQPPHRRSSFGRAARQRLSLRLHAQPCSGITDAPGTASCSITPNEAAGTYSLGASFAGDLVNAPSTATGSFVVTKEQTTVSYTGDTLLAQGGSANLAGTLLEDG